MTRNRKYAGPVRLFLGDHRILLSGGFLTLIILTAILAPIISRYNPAEIDAKSRFAGPSLEHWMGADHFGRDTFANILYGARTSLVIGFSGVGLAAIVGLWVGCVGGVYRSWTETIIMRGADVILCFPPILLAIFVVTFLGTSTGNIILVIAILYIPRFARLSYSSTLSITETAYVESALAIGASRMYIIRQHVVPNVLAPILVQFSLGVGHAILLESGLSFLGLGPPPPTPSWGRLIDQARRYLSISIYGVVAPGAVISMTVLSLNVLGDALRDKLDPKLRGRL